MKSFLGEGVACMDLGKNGRRKVEFPVSEIVKDRAKSQVPFLYVQGIWLYPLPTLWRIGQIS